MEEFQEISFSLHCDNEGKIIEIIKPATESIPSLATGNMLFSSVIPGEISKILNFFIEIKQKQFALNWQVNISTLTGARTFYLYGILYNDYIAIAAATDNLEAEQLFLQITHPAVSHEQTEGSYAQPGVNNTQTDSNRQRENPEQRDDLVSNYMPGEANSLNDTNESTTATEEPGIAYYEELSRLNNELINTQRTLAKSNIQLDELNKQKNRFLSIASHDLRNPLGIIIGYSSFLLDDRDTNLTDDHKEMLSAILSSGQFMLRLINNLLDLSAIESGKTKPELVKGNLVLLIKTNVEHNSVIAQKKNIKISFQASDGIPETLFDQLKIEQVLNNLISNAIKFSPQNTEVMVKVYHKEGEVIVTVKDEGPGIPESELKEIFEPFKKTSVKSTDEEKSTGLGLSIVSSVVKAHKGRVWVESRPGEGSMFCFALPAK